jgi:UDP-3-O-[3-hydroxymyristoyl] N-acetylglucosamine deacetylase/3-hydroxyacyl-[acyl-carrier-protein] dehydratase
MYQKTLEKNIEFEGIGLHTGVNSKIILRPAKPNTGIIFRDINKNNDIKAHINNVCSTLRGTTLSVNDSKIYTVEHLLSALYALGIDNAYIDFYNIEIPILDGSSNKFYELIESSGIKILNEKRNSLIIKEEIEVSNKDSSLTILPYDGFKITFEIDFKNSSIGIQKFVLETLDDYKMQIASSRTFCTFGEIVHLKENGLALGGNLDNAIIYLDKDISDVTIDNFNKISLNQISRESLDGNTLENKNLIFNNEAVRHKILDLIGDLSLLGKDIKGHVISNKSGHSLNIEMVKKINLLYSDSDFKFNKKEIEKIIPHRDPFLLIDEIIDGELGKYVCAIKYVDEKESYFKGHFPGNPIMPGVLIIECMAQTSCFLSLKTVGSTEDKLMLLSVIKSSRFLKKVVPGDKLFIKVELLKFRLNNALIKGSAKVNNELVAEAEWMATVVNKYENT